MDKRSKEELQARLTEIKGRLGEIDATYQGQRLPEAEEAEWNALNAELDEHTATVAQMTVREERLKAIAKEPENTSEGLQFQTRRPGVPTGDDIYDLTTIRGSVTNPEQMKAQLRERAMTVMDKTHYPHDRADSAQAKEAVAHLLASVDDEQGSIAKRIVATGSPTYAKAFAKAVRAGGVQFLNAGEFNALSLGTDSAGGFAVPFQLDPTIVPTSNLSVNPYRAISRIVQIAGVKEWDAVTSAGVTAHRVAEGTEAADDSPTLNQPTVRTERVQTFIPFSIELQQDWGGMQADLARLIQDAKDDEEASSFTVGNGTAPNATGVVTGATVTVSTAGTAAFASSDLDALEDALGTRFRSRAQWVGSRAIYNLIRHFADDNGPDLWIRIAQGLEQGGNTGQTLLGYRANEASAMATSVASGNKILILGDFNYFVIVDRIGLQMELVPHLFGGSGRPTGQRGYYCYWRNNSQVLSANAFRTLVVR